MSTLRVVSLSRDESAVFDLANVKSIYINDLKPKFFVMIEFHDSTEDAKVEQARRVKRRIDRGLNPQWWHWF